MAFATRQEAQAAVGAIADTHWAMAALATALESGIVSALTEPRSLHDLTERSKLPAAMVAALADVLAALGFVTVTADRVHPEPGIAALAMGPPHAFLLADLRASLLQAGEMVAAARAGKLSTGWHYENPLILETQGVFSEAAFAQLTQHVFPKIAGLAERLAAANSSALDIGCGVGGTAIALCRAFPQLRVAGIDPFKTPLAIARYAVERAGLTDRIALRQVGIEELIDRDTYDFVWLPQVFLDEKTFTAALPHVLRSLKPGGSVLAVANNTEGSGLHPAIGRLRSTLIGGNSRSIDTVAERLQASGFTGVQRIATPLDASVHFAVGWRPLQP